MISSASAVILALTINRKMLGTEDNQFQPFMHNDETKWLLKYWLLTCCHQIQAINSKTDPFGLSITHNERTAVALGITIDTSAYPFLPSRFGGRLAAVWLEKLAISAKDDHDDLLCEYARRCFDAAAGNTDDHMIARQLWLQRLMDMIDAAALAS